MSAAAEIERRFRRWAELEVEGDLDAWTEFIAEDAVIQPPGEPHVHGRDSIRAYAAAFFELPIAVMEPTDQRVYVSESEDLAVNLGGLRMVLDNDDGPQELDLKCMAVWQKQDGEWKIVANTWSPNTS